MTSDFEPAAVPTDDASYGEAVTDEEFAEWVARSQADTDRVIAEWDAGVEFHQRVERDPPPLDADNDPIEAELVDMQIPYYGLDWGQEYEHVTLIADPFFDAANRLRASSEARRNLTAQGFVVVDDDAVPRSSGLILPTDEVTAWARRTFHVPAQRSTYGLDNSVVCVPQSFSYFFMNGSVEVVRGPSIRGSWSVVPQSE